MKDYETDGPCSMRGEKIKKYRALLGTEERRLLDKPYAQMGFNTIKTDIKGI